MKIVCGKKERKEHPIDRPEEEAIRQVLVTQNALTASNPINLSGSNGVYAGNTYATRRLSRPYTLDIGFSNSIHGGINYSINKDRDAITQQIAVGNASNAGTPENVVIIGAGDGTGTNPKPACIDEHKPEELRKFKYDGFAVLGKHATLATQEPKSDEDQYAYRQKISKIIPGNIVSSSVNTGYSSLINKQASAGGFGEGFDLVNLHSDTTDITNEISIQGPFTHTHIGGRQSRHIHYMEGFDQTLGKIPNIADRPEAWNIYIAELDATDTEAGSGVGDGAIGFTTPDYSVGPLDTDQQKATLYREERAKRPVNIKNIQTIIGTGSHGNFTRNYEVMSTFGDQGYFLRRSDNLLPDAISQELPETTNYQTLIAQTSSVSGNYFGEGNNRQFSIIGALASPAFASFIMHQNRTTIPVSSIPDQRILIARAVGVAITFNITNDPLFASGDLDGSGYTVVSTNGKIWPDMVAEFETAFEHPTNGFGGDVIVVGSYDASGANGEQVAMFITEDTLVGSSGNGGTLLNTTSPPNHVYFDEVTNGFENGANSGITLGNIVETQDRSTGSANVIRTRFSAPGGPEVNSSGYLDVATQQYSVYNSINFRNLSTRGSGSGEDSTIRLDTHQVSVAEGRREGLRTLRTRHQGKFGIESQYGAVSSADYNSNASFHKQHRNTRIKAEAAEITILSPRYDNKNSQIKITTTIGTDSNYWVVTPDQYAVVSASIKLGASISTSNRVIFSCENLGATAFSIFMDQNTKTLTISSAVWFAKFDLTSVTLTEWNHIVAIAPTIGYAGSSNTFRLFVNQTEFFSTSSSTSFDKGGILGDIYIGSLAAATTDNLEGQIALVSYYGRSSNNIASIELSQMATDTNGSKISTITGFKNFWSLDCSYSFSATDVITDNFSLEDFKGRYPLTVINSGGFYTAEETPFERIGFIRSETYDNEHLSSLLPASDFQYSWINSSISGSNWENNQKVLTYAPKNGLIKLPNETIPALAFPGISEIYGE
jgi:hypothetical protein